MARQRMLHPGFFRDATLLSLPPLHRLLYAGLWGVADREGRLRDSPMDLKIELLPADHCDVNAMLNDLAAVGRIMRYVVDGARYLAIVRFKKYQHPHVREPASAIPLPPLPTEVPVSNHDSPPPDGQKHRASTGLAPGQAGMAGGVDRAESESESESESDPEDPPAPDRAGHQEQEEDVGQPDLIPGLPKPAKKERELSTQQRAKAYFDEQRAKKTDLSDEPFTPTEVNAMLKEPLIEYGKPEFARMIDRYFADQSKAEKSWPFRLFVKIHRSYHRAVAAPKSPGFKALRPEDIEKLHGH